MKVAIAGKGGVGKTTLAALLAREFEAGGYSVIAVDGDPAGGLGSALGFPPDEPVVPLAEMRALIDERMGTSKGNVAGYFKLNPRVADIPETYGRTRGRIRLIPMGTVRGAGKGCMCPESAFLRELTRHLLTERTEVVLLDLEAGLEHLGRGTAVGVDVMLVVLGPSRQSRETGRRIAALAREMGIEKIWAVVNALDPGAPEPEGLGDWRPVVRIPWSDLLRAQARAGRPVEAAEPEIARAVADLRAILEAQVVGRA